jgi:sugar lactone lactonase YvrE
MKIPISGRFLKAWRRYAWRPTLALAGMITAAAIQAHGQATVTTLTDANHGTAGYKDGNTFTAAQFRFPAGMALDPSETTLFMADCTNNAVRMVTAVGNKSSSFTYSAFTNKNGINRPIAIAVDPSTNVYVLNRGSGTDGTVLTFNGSYFINYRVVSLIATNASGLTNATSLTLDTTGNIYVTIKSNTVIRISGTNTPTIVGVVTNKGTYLRGVVALQNGKLALTDSGNNGIWVMDPANTNLANNSVKLTGFNGAGDVLGPPAFAAFNRPENIVKAGNGFLVVSDFNNHKIKVVDASGNVTRLYGVNPKYWSTSFPGWRDGTVNPNEPQDLVDARQPYGLAIANDGTVYVTETFYNLLRVATGTGLPALPPPAPAAPSIWSVTTSIGQVTLTWSPVASATNYNVKRSTSGGGPYTTIAATSSTTYTDTNVLGGVTYYYVVSALNAGGESPNSSESAVTVPLPPVPAPQIGYVDFPATSSPIAYTSVFHPVSSYDFYNDATIVIKGTPGSGTYYEYGYTSNPGLVPTPTTNSASVLSDYHDGLSFGQISPYLVNQVAPDLTIKTFGAKSDGSPNSAVVSSTFHFITGNPVIIGNNPGQFQISDITANSQLYYTIDGSIPSATNPTAIPLGPLPSPTNTWTIGFPVTSNTTFNVIAVRANYRDSAVVSVNFSPSNFVANTISFGFASGEASSDFVASPGQNFYAPVTLSLLPAQTMYSLQFNITVTNLGSIPVAPGQFNFTSLLVKPDPKNPGFYTQIPPYAFVSSTPPNTDTNVVVYNGGFYQNLQFANTAINLLGVGWLERAGQTNLYNALSQQLITYSQAHDVLFNASGGQVEVGGYSFHVPSNATSNDVYQIQIGRPSATSDGVGTPGSDVFIAAPTNGAIAGGAPLNALKHITIGQKKYIAGSVYPFRWFNAGDFGSTNIVNADVEQVFEAAAYQLNTPPNNTDFYDAMDSSGNIGILDSNPADPNYGFYTNTAIYSANQSVPFTYTIVNTNYSIDTFGNTVAPPVPVTVSITTYLYLTTTYVDEMYTNVAITYMATPPYSPTATNYFPAHNPVPISNPTGIFTLFDGNDTNINQVAFGDGILDVCDVYVTFRRSLDPSLTWFRRFWNNGQRVADTGAPNVAAHAATKTLSSSGDTLQTKVAQSSTVAPQVNFTAGDILGSAGQTVQIPINATIFGNYPLRVLMLNLNITPLDGSPALTSAVQFTPNTALGTPYTTDSIGNGNYSAVWLNSTIAGLTGTANIGTLTVTIPASAGANAAYAVHFDHASASPNGLGSFPKQTLTGLVTLSNRTNSSYGDGIPDSWRLRWFGTVNNILSVSNACPSGDGVNNWMKYVAGIDPNTAGNFPRLNAKTPAPAGTAAVHWPTVNGKQYVIERSLTLFPGAWSTISTNTGTGADMEFDDSFDGGAKYYRVRILP